jgi:hypothetical protein
MPWPLLVVHKEPSVGNEIRRYLVLRIRIATTAILVTMRGGQGSFWACVLQQDTNTVRSRIP